jgi:hypothetical protein
VSHRFGTTHASYPDRARSTTDPHAGQACRSHWVSKDERSMWCCEFSGFGQDRAALAAEIAAAQAVIERQPAGSTLVALDLTRVRPTPELAAFLQAYATRAGNPIRKMAIVGVSPAQRFWYRLRRQVTWPRNAAFFAGWEPAKAWLVSEAF